MQTNTTRGLIKVGSVLYIIERRCFWVCTNIRRDDTINSIIYEGFMSMKSSSDDNSTEFVIDRQFNDKAIQIRFNFKQDSKLKIQVKNDGSNDAGLLSLLYNNCILEPLNQEEFAELTSLLFSRLNQHNLINARTGDNLENTMFNIGSAIYLNELGKYWLYIGSRHVSGGKLVHDGCLGTLVKPDISQTNRSDIETFYIDRPVDGALKRIYFQMNLPNRFVVVALDDNNFAPIESLDENELARYIATQHNIRWYNQFTGYHECDPFGFIYPVTECIAFMPLYYSRDHDSVDSPWAYRYHGYAFDRKLDSVIAFPYSLNENLLKEPISRLTLDEYLMYRKYCEVRLTPTVTNVKEILGRDTDYHQFKGFFKKGI